MRIVIDLIEGDELWLDGEPTLEDMREVKKRFDLAMSKILKTECLRDFLINHGFPIPYDR